MFRNLLTIIILIGFSFFGLTDFTKDRLFGALNTYDVLLVFINLIFIFFLLYKKSIYFFLFKTPFRFIFYLYIMAIIVMLTMPLRGNISIVDAVRVGRDFLLIPLAPLLWDCIHRNNSRNKRYFEKLVLFIGFFTSIQIYITAIQPEIISDIFQYVRAREHYKFGLQRNDFLSKAMLMPHLTTLIVFSRNLKSGFTVQSTLSLIFFLIASGLQGFRSYFLVLVCVILFVLITNIKRKKYRRYVFILFFMTPFIFLGDQLFLNEQISNKIITAGLDVERDEGSSFKNRFDRDAVFTFPRFLEKPFFGWGFVYRNSQYGKEIGLEVAEEGKYTPYTLYSIDSGYLTLLNYFGIIGFTIVLVLLIRLIFHVKKLLPPEEALPVIGFTLILLLPLITHGGLYSDFGLLPLLICLSLYLTPYLQK